MNEIDKIKQLPDSKQSIAIYADKLIVAIEEGEINPLELLKALKGIEKVAEAIKPILNKHALTEIAKYPKGEADLGGVKFCSRDSGVTYSYEGCNDEQYNTLKAYLDEYSEKLKERQKFLQAMKEPMEIVTGDGEVITLYPPVKKSSVSIITSFT